MNRPTLPYPVTFVVKYPQRWTELFEASMPDFDSLHTRIQTYEDCWIILTYLYLKQRNIDVSIADRFIPGEICVVSSPDLAIRDLTFNSFVVGCRSDSFDPPLCDVAIVQNKANLESATDILIPHWTQPGLIPRLKERGNTIKNIAYKGDEVNLYEPFCSAEFQQELEKLGVILKINGRPRNEPVMWHDYRTDDLVLAVRDLTERDALAKPASKLVNAWTAGVPAMLGPEPAFRDLVQSELDYIEVKTPRAALEAIQQLKGQPERYQQMILNGLRRAEKFTVDNIAEQWYQALAGSIANQYKQWRRKTLISRTSAFALRSIQHKVACRRLAEDHLHGHRIISGQSC